MISLELAFAHLQNLPPPCQVQVVDYIQQLIAATRKEALRQTAGMLSPDEGKVFAAAIKECCEQVDE